MPVFFHPDTPDLPLPPGHRFPAGKYRLLRDKVLAESILGRARLLPSPAATREDLERAHAPAYVAAVFDGTLAPEIQRRIGLPWSPVLVARSRATVGGSLAAARAALDDYRAAGRFVQDDCDILIRQAILHVALGQPDATERVITRAVQIDGRLAAPMASAADAESWREIPPPAPVPAVAARGEAILRQIAASSGEPLPADGPAPAVLAWLEAAWWGHWSAAAAAPPAGEP